MEESTLEEIIAKAALYDLVVAYSRAVDRRDMALLESLYHPEAYDQHGQMYDGGIKGYIAFLDKALARYESTSHYVLNTAFRIEGDRAQGEVHKLNYHRERGDTPHEVITGSRSLDHYIRDNGKWRFLSRHITLDWAHRQPVNPAAYADFAAQSPLSVPNENDLSYQILSAFRRFGGK